MAGKTTREYLQEAMDLDWNEDSIEDPEREAIYEAQVMKSVTLSELLEFPIS